MDNKSDYEPWDVFNYPSHWDKASSGVLGRNFEVNPDENERVFLIFNGVFQNWQDVVLEYRKSTYLQEPVIRTSFREKSLEVEISGVGNEVKKVEFSIIDGDKVIKTFEGIQSTELENVTVFKAVIDWVDATLWMPDNPHLYVLKAELKVNNQVIDSQECKFGFREVGCEGIYRMK